MLRSCVFSFNYRLIVINVLIYDLIAAEIVIKSDFDKSSPLTMSMPSFKSSQMPASAIFMSHPDGADGRSNDNDEDDDNYYGDDEPNDADIVDDNCTAINETVDDFQNENHQIAFVAYRNVRSSAAIAATNTAALVESHDLLPLAMTRNSTVAMSAASSSSSSSAFSHQLAATGPMQVPSNAKSQRILSRPKRYLAFPEGSSCSVAVCFTVGIIGNPRYNYMAFGLNWGVAYDLPNTSWVLSNLHGFGHHPVPTVVLRRRSRRSLYKEIESVVDNMGYNGHDCVLRALCESRQYFRKTKLGMIGEMLRVMFSLPKQRIFTRELRENSDIELYDHAYRKAHDVVCAERYECSFSLLELAFGKYSVPTAGYAEQFGK